MFPSLSRICKRNQRWNSICFAGGGEESDAYRMLTAALILQKPDGTVVWEGSISSAWSFENFKQKLLVAEIGEGSHVVSGDYSYSVENLAFRAAYTLIGGAMDFR
ncbi:MAG: hypothetical protein GY765_41285 [bacterium]|nr:hypothetical protein [bacterium]